MSHPPQRFLRLLPTDDPGALQIFLRSWPRVQSLPWSRAVMTTQLAAVVSGPASFLDDPVLGELAHYLLDQDLYALRESSEPPWPNFAGSDSTLREARRLPIAVHGAILPGEQVGYGLPVGAVLATRAAVIPAAVGRDIGCRAHLSVFRPNSFRFTDAADFRRLRQVSGSVTHFGLESKIGLRREHPILDDGRWRSSALLKGLLDVAALHLGSSGTGNHFVDVGVVATIEGEPPSPAVLSHSGSRGVGQRVAQHYHALARRAHPRLPKELAQWAWLSLESEDGHAYWQAMELCCDYSLACHQVLHQALARELEWEPEWSLSAPHNFAALESWRGQEVVVHRKGAVRVRPCERSLICGSMTEPTAVVVGKDEDRALSSASHGLGRKLARSLARGAYQGRQVQEDLVEAGVVRAGGGMDEWPGVYGKTSEALEAHAELVAPVGFFQSRLVRMCAANDPSED